MLTAATDILTAHVSKVWFMLHVHVVKMINYSSGHVHFLRVDMERCPNSSIYSKYSKCRHFVVIRNAGTVCVYYLSDIHMTSRARFNQSWAGLSDRGVRVETKLLMTPSGDNIRLWSLTSAWCKCTGSVHWFSHHVKTIQQRQILSQSLPISFRPGEHCRSPSAHLPVSGFIPLKERDRKGEVGKEMSGRASKQWIILCLAATGEKAWQICPKPKPVGVVWKRKDSLREILLFGW